MFGLPPLNTLFTKNDGYASDSGGPGEFKYDGGPKPYIKKSTGEPSPRSAERVSEVKEEHKAKEETKQKEQAQTPAKPRIGLKEQVESYHKWFNSARLNPIDRMWVQSDLKNFDQIEVLTRNQLQALEQYKSGSDHIQRYLSFGEVSSLFPEEDLKADSDRVSKAINSFSTNNDLTLYRGVRDINGEDDEEETKKASRDYIDSLLSASPGDVVGNKAFLSASQDPNAVHEFLRKGTEGYRVSFEISVEKGQKALPTSRVSANYLYEREVLLDRDSKLRIESVQKTKDGGVVKASLLGKEQAKDAATDYTFIPEEHPRKKDDGEEE